MATYHFRCNNCNTLEDSSHAGERDIPLKCRTCGKGAHYVINDAGAPELVPEPENWTVLADLPPAELAPILEYHAIDASEIEAHTPFVTVAKRDDTGALVLDENEAVVHETTPREGPMVEPANPQFITVEVSEGPGVSNNPEVPA